MTTAKAGSLGAGRNYVPVPHADIYYTGAPRAGSSFGGGTTSGHGGGRSGSSFPSSSFSGSLAPVATARDVLANVSRAVGSQVGSAFSGVSSGVNSNYGDLQSYIDMMSSISRQNSAAAAAAAADQRDWTAAQTQRVMDFNSSEAAKARDWTSMMSNTAHQREVRDLIAAGLNPVLSASGGNGAAVTSGVSASAASGGGSTAQVDTSASGAIASILGTVLSAQNQMEMTRVNAQNNLAIAERYNQTNELIGRLTAGASYNAAALNRQTQLDLKHLDIDNPSTAEQYLIRSLASSLSPSEVGRVLDFLGESASKFRSFEW